MLHQLREDLPRADAAEVGPTLATRERSFLVAKPSLVGFRPPKPENPNGPLLSHRFFLISDFSLTNAGEGLDGKKKGGVVEGSPFGVG